MSRRRRRLLSFYDTMILLFNDGDDDDVVCYRQVHRQWWMVHKIPMVDLPACFDEGGGGLYEYYVRLYPKFPQTNSIATKNILLWELL